MLHMTPVYLTLSRRALECSGECLRISMPSVCATRSGTSGILPNWSLLTLSLFFCPCFCLLCVIVHISYLIHEAALYKMPLKQILFAETWCFHV